MNIQNPYLSSRRMRGLFTSSLFTAMLAVAQPGFAAEILDYDFNDSGSTQPNSGTLSDADLGISGAASIGADRSGVSGLSGDHALVTGNSGMGSGQSTFNGVATGNGDLSALTSLTITGWFKASTTLAGSASIFRSSGGTIAVKADAATPGALNLVVNNTASGRSSVTNSLYGATGSWVFFAITWDGSTVKFYQANTTTGVSQLGGNVSFSATMLNPASGLLIGGNGANNPADARPFAGSLDNFRLYDSVLSSSELESIRADNLTNTPSSIPEPASSGIVLGITGLAAFSLTRRQHK